MTAYTFVVTGWYDGILCAMCRCCLLGRRQFWLHVYVTVRDLFCYKLLLCFVISQTYAPHVMWWLNSASSCVLAI